MKPKHSLLTFILAGMLTLGLLAGSTIHANAARRVFKFPTFITFTNVPNINLGAAFTLSGYVKSNTGAPVAFLDVDFSINGTTVGQAKTNAAGYFQRKLDNKYTAGKYTVTATTKIKHLYLPAIGSTSFVILPAQVQVKTVPAVPGTTFNVGGVNFVSGPDGVAHINIGVPGYYKLTVLTNLYNSPYQRITFARWLDEVYTPFETIKVPSNTMLEVGLNTYQQVGETFVDLSGFPVSPTRIKQFTIRSAQGDLFTFTNGDPAWIPATRVARFQNGLIVTNLEYSVISMLVDGSNVVNQSQQRFFAHPNDTWSIALILYTLNIRAYDGLLGSSVGKSISLIYPDGHAQNYPLDTNGTVGIHGLARGNYTVQVLNDKGLKQIIPVALSRSQTVDIQVPTNLDLGVVLGLGLLVGLSLIVFPRLPMLRSRTNGNRPVHQYPQTALVKPYEVDSYELKKVKEKPNLPNPGIIKWF
jgi:hypothetical protein